MSQQRRDAVYGRRGGGWADDGTASTPLDRYPTCRVCGQPLTAGQRGVHHLCDSTSSVGRACTCPAGCSLHPVAT